jgi:SAM-dependent methyltransferase
MPLQSGWFFIIRKILDCRHYSEKTHCMKKWLQDKLSCPECLHPESRLELEIQIELAGDVIEGQLTCAICGKSYPIHKGIAILLPQKSLPILSESRGYNSKEMLSSYLWSHYGDLLHDPDATDAYKEWSSCFRNTDGGCALDIGCSVGRLSFELTRTHANVIGLDTSISFIQKARELMNQKQLQFDMIIEGMITEKQSCVFDNGWNYENVDFIVADALALPFSQNTFSTVASVNILEKVPDPMQHLVSVNRVLDDRNAMFVFSDPFSWDETSTDPERWLSGKTDGKYACRGMETMGRLFAGEDKVFDPPLSVIAKQNVSWKIRKTENLWEHIHSQMMIGKR